MKKPVTFLILLVTSLLLSSSVLADQYIEITMTVDDPIVFINQEEYRLDVAPIILNSRTLVPARFISEAFGAEVSYDAPTRNIFIRLPDPHYLKKQLLELTKSHDELLEKIEQLSKENTTLSSTLKELDQEIKELTLEREELRKTFAKKSEELKNTIQSLEELLNEMKLQLDKALPYENDSPEILNLNIQQGQQISEDFELQGDIKDESPVVMVLIKLGDTLLYQGQKISGIISPFAYTSGTYILSIEAYDAFSNKAKLEFPVSIVNHSRNRKATLRTELMVNYYNLNSHQLHKTYETIPWKIIDVRNENEYLQGHLPNAILIPAKDFSEETFKRFGLQKDDYLLIYCNRGVRSISPSKKLAKAGFLNVFHLAEGIEGWPYEIEY
jgi:rhodanese-related sulfurtransferase/regulator of replication initiation timing